MLAKRDLTVVMPVFNGGKYVGNAIDSILDQTFRDFEFLITDDGSTNDTPNILAEYARKDSRITVISQENAGIAESLNRMVRIAGGNFIARMDADDVSMPKRFGRQVAKLIANPDYVAVGCWVRELFENSALNHEIVYPDKPDLLKRHLRKGINCYTHGSVMMRRTVFEEFGLLYRFEEGEDFDLWLRLSERGTLGIVEEVLYQHYNHAHSFSSERISRTALMRYLMVRLARGSVRNTAGSFLIGRKKRRGYIRNVLCLTTMRRNATLIILRPECCSVQGGRSRQKGYFQQ